MSLLRALRKEIGKLPPVKNHRIEKYRRLFFTRGSSWPRFHGLFDSREAAEAAALDGTETVGYDLGHGVKADPCHLGVVIADGFGAIQSRCFGGFARVE